MRHGLLLAAAAIIALSTAGVATAQQSSPPAGQQTQPQRTQGATSAQTGATMDQASLQALIGREVVSKDGQELGEISDVILTDAGAANVVVLDSGGFLGMGAKQIAIDYTMLQMQGDRLVAADITQAQVEQMPEFEYEDTMVSLNRRSAPQGQSQPKQ